MTKVPTNLSRHELACFPIPHSDLQCNMPGIFRNVFKTLAYS
jgi:hypothetical protein